MPDIDTIADAVHSAFARSLDAEAHDVVNPNRQCIPPARFVLELARSGWTVLGVETARLSLDAILEEADDEAFDEGSEEEAAGGDRISYRNTWSGAAFVAACAARGIQFERASSGEPETDLSIAREALASAQSTLDAALATHGERSVLVETVCGVRHRYRAALDEFQAAKAPEVRP